MIKLDAIVNAVDRMTNGLYEVSRAIHRAVDFAEKTRAQDAAKVTVDKIVESQDTTGGMGRGW